MNSDSEISCKIYEITNQDLIAFCVNNGLSPQHEDKSLFSDTE